MARTCGVGGAAASLVCERKPYPAALVCEILTPTRDASSWLSRCVTLTKAGKCVY